MFVHRADLRKSFLGSVFFTFSASGLALLLVLGLSGCKQSPPPEKFLSNDISAMQLDGTFALTDHTGQARTLGDFKGKVVILLFGYTHCPDVCPTTLSEISLALKQLGADAARVQVLFVTLDPERDSQSILAQYVPSFNPTFLGLRGSDSDTAEVTKKFKVFYQKHETPGQTGYTLDHSASSYVIDRDGKLRLMVNYGLGSEALAHDLNLLLH